MDVLFVFGKGRFGIGRPGKARLRRRMPSEHPSARRAAIPPEGFCLFCPKNTKNR